MSHYALIEEIKPSCRALITDHIEWCQQLEGSGFSPPCVFGDVLKSLPENSYNRDDSFADKLYSIDRARLMKRQYCYTCGKQCPLFTPGEESEHETAGLPCVDMSSAGKRRFESGPTAPIFITHGKRHVAKRTRVILLENVQDRFFEKKVYLYFYPGWKWTMSNQSNVRYNQFNAMLNLASVVVCVYFNLQELHMGMIEKIYGRHYNIHPIYMDASDLGHSGSSRARVYIIMVLKDEVVLTYDCNKMFREISHAMTQLVSTCPEDYFVADETDLRLEEARVGRQRSIQVRPNATRIHLEPTVRFWRNCPMSISFSFCKFQFKLLRGSWGKILVLPYDEEGKTCYSLHQEFVCQAIWKGSTCKSKSGGLLGRQSWEVLVLVSTERQDTHSKNELWKNVHCIQKPMATWKKVVFFLYFCSHCVFFCV